ncbi:hypothetical protein HYFRA_00008409 [Hymenoscyphus fraxineus]|uniref:RRM domain-containing protein n=1 Tax=Hymenoscyphus fraxineus TaxID=746836 RepID=A0A9N9KRD6_9HELO|nr:hypothetical protein HYFRA_00008409 [Hymenoscyphus fraxineus]
MVASASASSGRSQANGVLPVPASQTQTAAGNHSSKTPGPKPPAPKLKVVIRRLPPALTEAEFLSVLGDEWKLAKGRVDYFLYKNGKDSKDPSKPSRPSRAYLHLTNESHLMTLSDTVRNSVFEDAQNTFTNSCLVGPPSVEFAPYGRTPGGRRRVDARAGTIDQDPEFMAFLEGLANPVSSKEGNTDAAGEGTSGKPEKVTTTPLVQYLKDKKANKHKEAAVKAAKKQEAHIAKGKPVKESEDVKRKGKDGKIEKSVERAAKEAVKILNREASLKVAATAEASKNGGSSSDSNSHPKLDLGRVPGRQRGAVIAAHIRMLQRDLGLSPAQAHRQVRRDTADAQKAEKAAAAAKTTETKETSTPAVQSPTVPTAPKAIAAQPNSRRSRAKAGSSSTETAASKGSNSTTASSAPAGQPSPVVLLKKPDPRPSTPATPTTPTAAQPTKQAPANNHRKPQNTAVPSDGATQAFIKHANPSQGVTEPLLKEALEKFGAVSMVEIDKRKGFAYVDFIDSAGLKKAMAANPISVAQGTVQVMQRKGTALPPEKKPVHQPHQPHQVPHAPSRGGRGGRGGTVGRRGGRGGPRGGGNGGGNGTQAPASAPTGPAGK